MSILVELVFMGAVVLGIGGWQLWSVTRKDTSAEDARHPVGEHPLDDR